MFLAELSLQNNESLLSWCLPGQYLKAQNWRISISDANT